MSIRTLSSLLLLTLVAACAPKEAEPKSAATPATAEPAAAKQEPDAPQITVRLGYQKIGAPYLLKERAAELQAKLAERNARAEWVEFQAGPPLLEAMRAGAVDLGYTGETPPVFAQAGGVPFVYVASDAGAPASEAILVPKGSKVKTVGELKGKKIAVNRGSNVHYLLLRALAEAKLTLKDVTVIYLAPPDARSAFDSGQVDAWVIWDPFQAAAETDGARILRDGQGLVDNRFYYLARREFAVEQPALLETVLDEYKVLSSWAKANPEEVARILAKSSGIAYESLLRAEKRHVYEVEPITPEILQRQQTIADTFKGLELIPREIKTSEAFLASAAYGSGS
jgi:sulfonate transport system substrate-binding protein